MSARVDGGEPQVLALARITRVDVYASGVDVYGQLTDGHPVSLCSVPATVILRVGMVVLGEVLRRDRPHRPTLLDVMFVSLPTGEAA
jgi:hypothetical protein